jgi:glycosyltransferase involved in cell wall biosynthesis
VLDEPGGKLEMTKRLSLVMATLGRTVEIDRCVDSLAAQTCHDFELIVVDQNPDDRLVPVVARARELGLDCRHLRQSEPNLCKARNTGIDQSAGEVVAFPDDDCWYEPDVVERVLARFQMQTELDGLVVRWYETGEHSAGRLSFEQFSRFRGAPASSITIFFRRECLRRAGGFDFALGLHSWYGAAEETDLMLRVLGAGGVIDHAPDIVVHHAVQNPARLPAGQMFRHARKRARGTGALYVRHKMSAWVIVRGMLAPVWRACLNVLHPARAAHELGLGVGIFEGYVGWLLGYRLRKEDRGT